MVPKGKGNPLQIAPADFTDDALEAEIVPTSRGKGGIERRGVRLRTPRDIRRMLARVANAVLMGELDNETGRTLGYLGGTLLKASEASELEDRIARLEEAAERIRR